MRERERERFQRWDRGKMREIGIQGDNQAVRLVNKHRGDVEIHRERETSTACAGCGAV